jgi:hypothetical protein
MHLGFWPEFGPVNRTAAAAGLDGAATQSGAFHNFATAKRTKPANPG